MVNACWPVRGHGLLGVGRRNDRDDDHRARVPGARGGPGDGLCPGDPQATSQKIAVMGDSIATMYGASTPERSRPERKCATPSPIS